jgi:hypothetical protein
MPPKILTAEQVAEIDRQQQKPVNWSAVIPQKEDVLTARVNREAARQDAPPMLTAEQTDAAEAQNSVAAETSFGRAMGARPDRSVGPQVPAPKKVLSAAEVDQADYERVGDISYIPTKDEWKRYSELRQQRDDNVGKFIEAGQAIAGGLVQAAAATAYAPFDFVTRGTKAYDEWVNSSAEGIRQASISTAELWSWAGDVVNDSVRETERVNVIDNQLRQRLAAENKFTGNAQADAQIFAQARERAMASGAYGKTQEQEADDENTQYQRFIRDRSFQQQAANITETNIGTLPDGRAEMGIDASKLNPGLVTTTALVADPLNFALPIGFGAVNKLRVLRRVASLTGTPLRGAGKAAGAMAQGSENIYSRIVEGVENATGIGEAGQAAAVSAVSWKAAAAMATLKGSGRVLRNVERGLETGSILAREIGISGVGVSRVEAAKKLRGAPIPERYRRAYDGFFTSPDSTLRRVSETPGLSPIARRSAATLDKLGATQVFRATDDALSGALATAPIAVPLAAIAPEERRPEILGALMTVGAGAGIVGGKVRRMSEFDDALVAKMLADADISGGDAASLANALPHDKLVNMARMQSVISAKADFIPLRAKDYALDTTVNEAMGLGTRGIHVDAQKGKRPRIYLNIDKIATGDVAGHEIGHAIFRSNILGGEIKQGMRGMVDVQYGMDGIAARGREYVNSQLTQEVRDGTTGIQLNVLKPDEVQRIAAAGGDEAAEQALKQEFIRERWAKDADWRKQAIDERTDMLNQERLAQGETAWDWARDEIAAETFSGLGKGLNLSGIRASGPLGRAVGAAQATMEAMGARFKGNGRLETPNQLFVENPLFDTPEMRKAVSNYVKTYDRYLVGLEKEGKVKQRGTPIAPTGKASDAARSPHTRTYANTKNGVTVVESDLFIERPDGTRVPKSQEMINTQEKARAATLKSINDRTKFAEREGDWGARKLSNGRVEVGGPTLPLQFDNFIQVPQWLRIKARDFEAGRAEGRSYLYSVNVIGSGESGSYKVKNLGNVEAKVGEMVPFGWAVSQKNHLLTKVIDLNSFRAATMRAIDNEQLGEFGNDLRAVEAGLKQMLRNYQDGNPGETGLGVTKKNILNGLLGTGTVTQRQNNPAWYTLNNQGSVRTFRFDRLNYADPYGTGYFPHYNKININALPDDAGHMSMDSYRQFDADRKVAWMNKEAAKRGYSNATNWQGADPQGFQAADAQYRQEFPQESMPQQIPRSAQGMPDAVDALTTDQLQRQYEENQGYLGLSTLGMREGRPVRGGAAQTRGLLRRNDAISAELERRGVREEDPQLQRALQRRGQAMPDAVHGDNTPLPPQVPDRGFYVIGTKPTADGRVLEYHLDPATTIQPRVADMESIRGEQVAMLEADRHNTRGDNMGGPLHPFLISNQTIARLLDGRGFKAVWANMNSAFVTRAKNIVKNTTAGHALIQIMKENAHRSNRKFVMDVTSEIDARRANMTSEQADFLHVLLELGAINPQGRINQAYSRIKRASDAALEGEATMAEVAEAQRDYDQTFDKYQPMVEFLNRLSPLKSHATRGRSKEFAGEFASVISKHGSSPWYSSMASKYRNTKFVDEAARFSFKQRGAAMDRITGIPFAPDVKAMLKNSMDFVNGQNLDVVGVVQLSKDMDAFAVYFGKNPKEEAKMSANERMLRDQFLASGTFKAHPSYDWVMLGPENADSFILDAPADPLKLFPDYAKNHPNPKVKKGSKETVVGTMKKSKIPLVLK